MINKKACRDRKDEEVSFLIYRLFKFGMVFYFISDFLLMFQYFYKTDHRDKLKLAKMYFYFIGVYLIAYSISA